MNLMDTIIATLFLFFFNFQAKFLCFQNYKALFHFFKTQATIVRKIIPHVFSSFTHLYSQEDIYLLFSTVRMMQMFIMQYHLKSLFYVLHQKDEVNEN